MAEYIDVKIPTKEKKKTLTPPALNFARFTFCLCYSHPIIQTFSHPLWIFFLAGEWGLIPYLQDNSMLITGGLRHAKSFLHKYFPSCPLTAQFTHLLQRSAIYLRSVSLVNILWIYSVTKDVPDYMINNIVIWSMAN